MNDQKRSVVFFDIDGTLFGGNPYTVPESAKQAIRKLRENGHLTFINTGRTLVSIDRQLQELGFDGYACGCGTHIYMNGETLFSHSIPHDKCAEIVAKLREFKVPAFCEAEDRIYMDERLLKTDPVMAEIKGNFVKYGLNVQDFPDDPESGDYTFDKVFCVLNEYSDEKSLREYMQVDFSITPQSADRLEMVPKHCDKGEAIRILQEKLGIAPENCYAIGDSENDLPMLKAVPNSIAMGECAPAILPYCSYQTDKVTEDGIKKALEHFGLI